MCIRDSIYTQQATSYGQHNLRKNVVTWPYKILHSISVKEPTKLNERANNSWQLSTNVIQEPCIKAQLSTDSPALYNDAQALLDGTNSLSSFPPHWPCWPAIIPHSLSLADSHLFLPAAFNRLYWNFRQTTKNNQFIQLIYITGIQVCEQVRQYYFGHRGCTSTEQMINNVWPNSLLRITDNLEWQNQNHDYNMRKSLIDSSSVTNKL